MTDGLTGGFTPVPTWGTYIPPTSAFTLGGAASGSGSPSGPVNIFEELDKPVTWSDPYDDWAIGKRVQISSLGQVRVIADLPKPDTSTGGAAPISYGEPFRADDGSLWQQDSRGKWYQLSGPTTGGGGSVINVGGGQFAIANPDGTVDWHSAPGGGQKSYSSWTNPQTGQAFWVDPTDPYAAPIPIGGGSTYTPASAYLRSSSGGGGGITGDAITALAKIMGGGQTYGGGGASAVDPNIAAREQAEINIMNKRFELDKTLALLEFQMQMGLIDRQEGERMMDRAIQAAGFGAQNRLDLANFDRLVLQDKLNAAAQFSQQIGDVNPAAYTAWLEAGGGDVFNALAQSPQGPLNDLTALGAARTLQAIETPIQRPAPYNPLEYLSMFQNALPQGGTGAGGGFSLPGVDLGDLFGGISVPTTGGGGGTTGGTQTGGSTTTTATAGPVTGNPTIGLTPAFGLFGDTYQDGKRTSINTSPLLYQASNGGYLTADGTYLSPGEGLALYEALGGPTGIDAPGFRATDLAVNGDVIAGLQGRVQGITGNQLFIDTGGTEPTINPNLFAGMSDFDRARAMRMMEVQGLGGWAGLATSPTNTATAPGVTVGGGDTNQNIFYAHGGKVQGDKAIVGDPRMPGVPNPEVVDFEKKTVTPIPMGMMNATGLPRYAYGTMPQYNEQGQFIGYADPYPTLQTTTGANLSAGGQLTQTNTQPAPLPEVSVKTSPATAAATVPAPVVEAATQSPVAQNTSQNTSQVNTVVADPLTDVIMPGDQAYIDRVLALRRATEVPGVNPYAANLFQSVDPIVWQAWLKGMQTRTGVPSESLAAAAYRYAPIGVDRSGIRVGV